jgi:hypothetical protein
MPDFPSLSFFSFVHISDPAHHETYNRYHQLDHRPANLALPGIHWGERFVRTPRCAEVSDVPDPRYADLHYINYYLFADPSPQSRAAWIKLGSLAAFWGRKPDHVWARREVGFFETLLATAHPRVRVPPDVVPMRPHRGIHVTVEEVSGDPEQMHLLGEWFARSWVPRLMECPHVAGVWTSVSEHAFPVTNVETATTPVHLITTVFLDGDPVEFTRARAELVDDRPVATRLLCSTPTETIEPWSWGWFDGEAADAPA